jgi:hypothetical protein
MEGRKSWVYFMPDLPTPNGPALLPQRFDEYARTAEGIVLRGIEHPTCELKQTLSLDRGNITDRLDFIKLLQGMANSHAESECLIIIGADQKERKFVDLANAAEFDPARVGPILAKYLSPEPKLEIFHNMRAPGGEQYVLNVLDRAQPRPIMTLVDGDAQGQVRFRPGDIWIKDNTRLRTATRADLDIMYRPKIEQEAAKQARIIFEHLKADLGPELLSQAVTSTPTPELLVGSRQRLARFVEAMISSADPSRFKMLIEMARQVLVEKWRTLLQGAVSPHGVSENEKETVAEFYKSEFIPALTSLVDLGVVVIRFDAPDMWLGFVSSLLVETFETSRHIDHLQAINQAGDNSVPFARPVYEIYLGSRVLATYAVFRRRFHFLKEIIQKYVNPLSLRHSQGILEPMLFWPFSGHLDLPDMRTGRNEEFWRQRIEETWGQDFGSKSDFLTAAAQFEFLLELNSYLLLQYSSPATDMFRTKCPEKRTAYLPDFWNTPLRTAIPTASWILESLVDGKGFPHDLAIEPQVTSALFDQMPRKDREVFVGEFLSHLRSWQDQVMMQQSRFPFLLEWPPRLQDAVDAYKSRQASQKP